ncbi:(d)CMP kinase [Rubrobacter aplysinae]|uniref:(d)CMP kinase n=1 Tax=Rubrobacter aplysinae TaxID=909625 RepID=UPI000AC02D68|nr:(d)CMP kinase [Rubrobacter aplysinae]
MSDPAQTRRGGIRVRVSDILPGMKPEPEDATSLIIAIDGPAGSGKSSVAREVASRLEATNLNTGGLYRAVALVALRDGVDVTDGPGLAGCAARLELDGEGVSADGARIPEPDLRTPEVSAAASSVSMHPEVREVLGEVQRQAASGASRYGGGVVEGRDIGTVVLPEADLKIFLSASAEERARRRAAQTGREEEIERIRRAIQTRDRQDSEREASPLKPARDAVILDTTSLALDQVVERITGLAADVQGRASNRGEHQGVGGA